VHAYIPSVTAPMPINPFRVVLRHRNFRLFLIGQTLSLIGSWMQTMAVGWLALQLTNSAFYVGLVATASSIPILLFTMHAGSIVDRSDKLRIVRIAQVAFLVEATTLWLLTATHRITIVSLLALAFIAGLIASIEIPARQAMMIDLVGRDDLPDAIALNSSGFNLARVVGPGLAAATIARFGLAWCFFLNAASFLAVLAGLFMMQLPPWTPRPSSASPWQGVMQVMRYMRDTPEVRALMLMVTVYSVLAAPLLALMPVIAKEMFRLEAGGYGLLLSFLGIGGLFGALSLAAVGDRVSRIRLLTIASMIWPVLLVLFSFTRTPWVAYTLLLAIGCVMILNGAIANALLQSIVPDALRGRIMAAYGLVVVGLAQVVGAFTGGVVAHVIGVAPAILAAAVLMQGYGLWAFVSRPELRSLGERTVRHV
jgi:MFS family permease